MPNVNVIVSKIILRRGTLAEWTSANPTLAEGEIVIETDTGRTKAGDGSLPYLDLGYLNEYLIPTWGGIIGTVADQVDLQDELDLALPKTGGALSGAVTTSSTIAGRDIEADGAKLDGIEASATTDQTGAEIKVAYELEADTNAFTDAEQTKLSGIETAATADQTGSEILAALLPVDGAGSLLDADLLDGNEASAFSTTGHAHTLADVTDSGALAALNTVGEAQIDALAVTHGKIGLGEVWLNNIISIADATILGNNAGVGGPPIALTAAQVRTELNVEDGATADQTGAQIKVAYEAEANTNAFTDAEQTKLTAIEALATADQSDAEIATAYGNEVAQVSVGERTAGTETALRTFAPADIASMSETHAPTASGTAPTSPADGRVWLDTTSHGLYYWNNAESLWIDTCRESTLWGKPGASGTGSGYFLLSANLNLGTYGLEVQEDMILDSVAFSCDGTTSGSWTFRVKKNGTQIYGLAAPTSGSYDEVYSGDLISNSYLFAAGDRISTEFGSGAASASFTDSSLIVYWRRTI